MPWVVLRIVVILLALALGGWMLAPDDLGRVAWPMRVTVAALVVAATAIVIVADHWLLRRPRVAVSVVGGLLLGLAIAHFAAGLFYHLITLPTWMRLPAWGTIALVACYLGIAVLLRVDWGRRLAPSEDAVPLPSMERSYVLDTSAIIDGRIAELVDTHVFNGRLVVPNYVIAEVQGIADSGDKLRRARGRRGLDVLNRLRTNTEAPLDVVERDLPEYQGQSVDARLVLLARHLGGKIVTGDYNLNKVAQVHGVPVVNLNDVAHALRPSFLPGESFEVIIVKTGEEPGQGVGYLDDGTMVVVADGRDKLQQAVRVVVTSVLQTSAGRMIFARLG